MHLFFWLALACAGEGPVEYFVGTDAERFEFCQDGGGEIGGCNLRVGDEGGDFLGFGEGFIAVFEHVLTAFLARVNMVACIHQESAVRRSVVDGREIEADAV